MPYQIAGIDVHKKMLAVMVADVEVAGDYHFERTIAGINGVSAGRALAGSQHKTRSRTPLPSATGRPTHGYAIAVRSDGAFDLPEGTLYPALDWLERAGLLSSRWSEVNGRRRRVYQLTRAGHRALAKRQGEWRDFARAVHAVVESPA
jgi:hypothetical protein